MGQFLKNLFVAIGSIFLHAETIIRKVILPKVVGIVNALKFVTELDKGNIIQGLIARAGVEIDENQLRIGLSKALVTVRLMDASDIDGTTDDRIAAALETLHFSSDDTKRAFYKSIGDTLIVFLSDGKLDWTEATIVREYYYKTEPGAQMSGPVVLLPAPAVAPQVDPAEQAKLDAKALQTAQKAYKKLTLVDADPSWSLEGVATATTEFEAKCVKAHAVTKTDLKKHKDWKYTVGEIIHLPK